MRIRAGAPRDECATRRPQAPPLEPGHQALAQPRPTQRPGSSPDSSQIYAAYLYSSSKGALFSAGGQARRACDTYPRLPVDSRGQEDLAFPWVTTRACLSSTAGPIKCPVGPNPAQLAPKEPNIAPQPKAAFGSSTGEMAD